ncbi:DUF397 domain-containing protein [Streptomyces antibioticus]|uniref:DUF397 domain-containing protein n=1 Tax=Streptomyces antibioticus TaxID=1890 RepID=UPI00224E7268|nr:DUF397 domain-containing protein [Streptomyces antibioticus]MCX5168698.1 DUF397 domain-containing protein [Streptomyces antibioticus]
MTEHTVPDSVSPLAWRKSSYSGPEGGSCVEVLDGYLAGVPVRDSKSPQRPALVFSSVGWSSFVAAVKSQDIQA